MPSAIDVNSLKVTQLKDELRKRGLPTKGLKADLVEALKEAISNESETAAATIENTGTDKIDDAAKEAVAEAVESAVNDTVTVEAPAPAEHVESHKSQSMASASSEASEAPATNAGATVSNEGNAEKSNEVETPNMEGKENEGDKLSQTKEGVDQVALEATSAPAEQQAAEVEESSTTSTIGGKRSRDDEDSGEGKNGESDVVVQSVAKKHKTDAQASNVNSSMSGSQAAAFLGGNQLKCDEFVNPSTGMVQLKIYVPSKSIGAVIGRGGVLVKNTRTVTGCGMQIPRDDTNVFLGHTYLRGL